ncbi:MAG: hypothetical protein M1170_00560 [Patescibacteria group bacterium]|nr:hypothetical protein [Patescibacteria group bacterium]
MKFERSESKMIEKIMADKMYEKAHNVLMEDIICPEDFIDLYGLKNVEEDIKYVKKMEDKFNQEESPEKKELRKIASVLEAVVYDQVETNDWLGADATSIKSSRYDDIKNGVDNIVEFYKEEDFSSSHMALAIDETFSSDINEKFERIKKEIKQGELAQIKYFVSDRLNIRGELSKIPRVVIGADAKTIKEVGELWLEKNNKDLAKHPVQFLIIEEMLLQLEAFKNYAQKVNQPDIALIYEKTQKILQKIYDDKKDLKNSQNNFKNDGVYNAITNNLKLFQF